jgi:hydrogenase 3 maturation protease
MSVQVPPDPHVTLRVAIVGIGNELAGDDGVGMHVVRALGARAGARPDLLVLETGTAPENFTGPLRRFGPTVTILVDAADLGERPGAVAWADWQASDGFSASTHTLPPSVFARYLIEALGSRVLLLGIQPEALDFGQPPSPAVEAAVEPAVALLSAWLAENLPGQNS